MPEQGVQVPISAEDLTGPAFASATAKSQAFQTSVSGLSGSFKEARASVAVFNEEIGIKMSRHLQSAIASSQLLQGVLSKAFPIIAAAGFLEIAARIPEMLKNAFDVVSGIDAEDKMIEANSRLEESLHKIAEKTAEAAAAYARLGQSAQTVAIMDREAAAGQKQSAEAQLMMLKSMLVAQEALAQQRERVGGGGSFRGGTPMSYQSTNEAKTAQSMIPALKDQISQLTNGMKLLEIGSDTAGKKLDESLTTAFDKAAKAGERAAAATERWQRSIEKLIATHGPQGLAAPGQSLLDAANIPGNFSAPSWMDQLSTAQTSSLYSGSNAAMQATKVQTDQAAAVEAAQQIYDETATKAQKYSDAVWNLTTLLDKGRISQQQFDAAVAQAGTSLDKSGYSKAFAELGKTMSKNVEEAMLFQESWSKALRAVLADIVKLILQMEVFSQLADQFGFIQGVSGSGGFLGQLFGGMSGGHASGGYIPPGQWGVVGEKGPELAFGGASGLNITPNSASGGGTTHQYFDMRGSLVTSEVVTRAEAAAQEKRTTARSVAMMQDLQARR
jgi:hypothetical protein